MFALAAWLVIYGLFLTRRLLRAYHRVFYPVCPASDEYAVGSPLFKHATIHLENGNDIVIEAPENSPENRYVGSMTFDGEELEKPCLKYSELKMGAKILFDMQAQK